MRETVVITTSYPRAHGDAQGHFVATEVRRLCERGRVTVLAPGAGRSPLWDERVVSIDGGEAFGFPGALERLRARRRHVFGAARFVFGAMTWLRRAPVPQAVLAHFLLPCGVPIATRGIGRRSSELEIVVHGSDARLFTALGLGRDMIARELLRTRARLRFVSSELRELVLRSIAAELRAALSARCRVEPSPIDISGVRSKREARLHLGVPPGIKLAVIVARLVPGKRVDVALEACERAAGWTTIVVGDGPLRGSLARRFSRARFVGQLDRNGALDHISAADVLVSASLTEGAPTVVREARALGTEVVCLDAGDVRAWAESDPGLHVVGLGP